MSKKAGLILLIAVVVIVGCLLVWQLAGKGSAPAVELMVETSNDEEPVEVVETEAPTEDAVDVSEKDAPMEMAIEDIFEETDGTGNALVPVKEKGAVTGDPEALRVLAEMKEKLGWDMVQTLKYSIASKSEGMEGESFVEVVIEKPGKVYSHSTAKWEGKTHRYYQVTDGVFLEMGTISEDGVRQPLNMGDVPPITPGSPDMLGMLTDTTIFEYTSVETVDVDASDPLFQKEDDTPIVTGKLLRLSAHVPEEADTLLDLYLDESSMEIAAIRLRAGMGIEIRYTNIEYKDIAEGIRYPVGFSAHVDLRKMREQMPEAQRANMPEENVMSMVWSDVSVNTEIAPETFYFTSKTGQ